MGKSIRRYYGCLNHLKRFGKFPGKVCGRQQRDEGIARLSEIDDLAKDTAYERVIDDDQAIAMPLEAPPGAGISPLAYSGPPLTQNTVALLPPCS